MLKFIKRILNFKKLLRYENILNEARILIQNKKYEDASLKCQEAIVIMKIHLLPHFNEKQFKWVYYNEALIYVGLKYFKKALNVLEYLIHLDDTFIDAMLLKGMVKHYNQDFNDAIIDFEHCISIAPNDSRAYFNIGKVLFKLKEHNKAIQYFKQSIDLNDRLITPYLYLGMIYFQARDEEKVSQVFNKLDNENIKLLPKLINREFAKNGETLLKWVYKNIHCPDWY